MKTLVLFLMVVIAWPIFTMAGSIKGTVIDKKSEEPLPGVNLVIVGTNWGTASDADGAFLITDLPEGVYAIEVSMIGFEVMRLDSIAVNQNNVTELDVGLQEAVIPLSEVVVTPGRFSLASKSIEARQTLKREDIRSFPQFGEDIYRAVLRIPGLSGSDYSSKFGVRGGEQDEVLVMLDGLQLYDPFHLKDFGGSVSVIDVEAIGGVDIMTGAFPVEYGDRQSGVFNIRTANPTFGQSRTSVALSFMNARFFSEGSFADGRAQWMVLARRGYIDVLLKIIGEDDNLSPVYYDVLGKLLYQLNLKNQLSFNFLRSDDDLEFKDEEDFASTGYGNTYGWLTWRSELSEKLFKQTVLSIGHITTSRDGFDVDVRGVLNYEVEDQRSFNFWGLRQDWSYDLSKNISLKWGGEFKKLDADYDYFTSGRVSTEIMNGQVFAEFDSSNIKLKPTGEQLGVYIGTKFRFIEPLTTEVGLRYDDISWTKDAHFSPRVNFSFALTDQTNIRAGWGKFYQSQGIHELDIQDGVDKYFPAELSEHRVVGVEHEFDNGINVRVEGYQKRISDLRPWYQNLLNDLEFFPERESDRVRLLGDNAEAKGVELFIKQDQAEKFKWWASYSYSFAEDNIKQIENTLLNSGQNFPRGRDQRHSINLDFSYKPNPKWRLNLGWVYHSGWPYTEESLSLAELPDGGLTVVRNFGEFNGQRYPNYHRMDLRINRFFKMRRGLLSFFFEVRNLYDQENVRVFYKDWNFNSSTNTLTVFEEKDPWLPLLPSFGISYDF